VKIHELLYLFTLCLRVLSAWSMVVAGWMGWQVEFLISWLRRLIIPEELKRFSITCYSTVLSGLNYGLLCHCIVPWCRNWSSVLMSTAFVNGWKPMFAPTPLQYCIVQFISGDNFFLSLPLFGFLTWNLFYKTNFHFCFWNSLPAVIWCFPWSSLIFASTFLVLLAFLCSLAPSPTLYSVVAIQFTLLLFPVLSYTLFDSSISFQETPSQGFHYFISVNFHLICWACLYIYIHTQMILSPLSYVNGILQNILVWGFSWPLSVLEWRKELIGAFHALFWLWREETQFNWVWRVVVFHINGRGGVLESSYPPQTRVEGVFLSNFMI